MSSQRKNSKSLVKLRRAGLRIDGNGMLTDMEVARTNFKVADEDLRHVRVDPFRKVRFLDMMLVRKLAKMVRVKIG